MEPWLQPAIDYIHSWIEFQMRASQQPGCIVAIAHRGKVVGEFAFGHANLATGEKLTPRHRFRIASHSKSFTSAGIMKLREQRKLRLDDPVGQYVKGLHRHVAETTIAQILSHSAGLVRDGMAGGQFSDSRPFLSTEELMADLGSSPLIEPNTRFKYSNHGFGLIGLVIEAISRRAVSRLHRTRDRRCRRTARNAIRHAPRQGHAVRPWPQPPASGGPPSGHSRREQAQCGRAGRRLRQHGSGRRPLLRATRSRRKAKRALRRQPPRNDAPALAQPPFEYRELLRPRNHERQSGRLGLASVTAAGCRATSRGPAWSPHAKSASAS